MPRTEQCIEVAEHVSLHTIISTPNSPSARPTLLLLHFWGGTNRTWTSLIKHLQEDFCIIAPSLRGFGQSSKPIEDDVYRIADHTTDVDNLIQHLHTQQPDVLSHGIILAGHSMGGKIAQLLVSTLADSDLLKGLILLGPAPSSSFALPEDMREQQIHAYDSISSATFVVQNVLLGNPDNVGQTVVASLAEDAVSGSRGARAAWPAYGMAEDHERTVIDAVAGYSHAKRTLRVLVFVGELDRVETPQNVEKRVAKVLSDAGAGVETVSLAGVGHLMPVEAPLSLERAILKFARTEER